VILTLGLLKKGSDDYSPNNCFATSCNLNPVWTDLFSWYTGSTVFVNHFSAKFHFRVKFEEF